MKLLTKKDVSPICKNITDEFEEWSYTNSTFKKDIENHSTIYINPLWAMQLSAQPTVVLTNKKVNRLSKILFNETNCWISLKDILAPNATLPTHTYQKLVYTLQEAEDYIRDFFTRGLVIIDNYYNYLDESELLDNMPIDLEGNVGVGYCLSRIIRHDFETARKYANDEIKTIQPKHPWVEQIKSSLPIFEEKYQKTGSVL